MLQKTAGVDVENLNAGASAARMVHSEQSLFTERPSPKRNAVRMKVLWLAQRHVDAHGSGLKAVERHQIDGAAPARLSPIVRGHPDPPGFTVNGHILRAR